MPSDRWLQRESRSWVDNGIISENQRRQILELYQKNVKPVSIMVILASLLIGFGLLSFIAANWQGMSNGLKLLVIFTSLLGVYGLADWMHTRKQHVWGIAFSFLGVLIFGIGLMLIGQMYHIVTYNAGAVFMWAAVSLLMAYVYRNDLFVILGLILLTTGEIYSVAEFHSFSYMYFILFTVFVVPYLIRYPSGYNQVFSVLSFSFSILLFVIDQDQHVLWMLPYAAALLLLSDVKKLRRMSISSYLRVIGYVVGFLFLIIYSFDATPFFLGERDGSASLIAATVILLAGYGLSVWKKGDAGRLFDVLLFMPVFFHNVSHIEWLYILTLFVFSLYLIIHGSRHTLIIQVNFGIVVFVISCLIAYGQLAWAFMPKSLFFVVGGLLLFGLSFWMQRQKHVWLKRGDNQ